jgi:hypothetical protein
MSMTSGAGEKLPLSEGGHDGGAVGGEPRDRCVREGFSVPATNSVARATSAASSMLMLRVRLS